VSAASFGKRQREKERRERAQAKAERRAERRASAGDEVPEPHEPADEAVVLVELEALHARFDAGDIDFDDFTEAKQQLTERLRIT